jgi:Flp pilus assembly protein TadG
MTLKRAGQRGVAAVEMGLLLVPLVTLVFGITELGRAIYQYNAIAKSVRTAARFLSQYEAGDGARATQARCLVVHGNTACTGAVLAPGLTTSMVQVADAANTPGLKFQPIVAPGGAQVGITNLVRVTVTGYQFTSLVSFVVPNITFDPIRATLTQAIP